MKSTLFSTLLVLNHEIDENAPDVSLNPDYWKITKIYV